MNGSIAVGQSERSGLISRLPTGAKLFLSLSAALLPLAMIALYAALQSNRLADQETRSRLRVAAIESSRALAIELNGDMNALGIALNALEDDPTDRASCARAQGVFAEQIAAGARFAIVDAHNHVLCGGAKFSAGIAEAARQPQATAGVVVPGRQLVLARRSNAGKLTAIAIFPQAFLSAISRPSGYAMPYATDLVGRNGKLTLGTIAGLGSLDRIESVDVPLGTANLSLEMRVRSAPLTSPLIVAMLLPLLMWAAATSISWVVVDRLLIRPLRRLRTAAAAYRPGEEIDPRIADAMPAQEIRELGETFRSISQTVKAHEAGLAEGLVRQTKLTREVHHRVKNNLQVISSLINFHSRGSQSAEATAAYAAIQRRVDALAVVHRNHYAELEENRGLSLRSVIGDLASNIRATTPEDLPSPTIVLDIDSVYANQDVTTAIAFMITELIELAIACEPRASVRVSIKAMESESRAQVSVESAAFIDSERLQQLIADRFGRVLLGFARQMRSTLDYDALLGRYRIAIAISDRD